MTYDKLGDALQNLVEGSQPIRGRLGYSVSGQYMVSVPNSPELFYVRTGKQSFVTAYHNGRCAPVPDLPVLLERVKVRGKYRHSIVGVDFTEENKTGVEAEATIGTHHHGRFSPLAYEIDARLILQFRVRPLDGTNLYVRHGFYKHLGMSYWWPGGNINLASLIPQETNRHAWVIIGIDTESAPHKLKAVRGNLHPVSLPLTGQHIAQVAFSGIPLCAVRVSHGKTRFTEHDFEALHNLLYSDHGETSAGGNIQIMTITTSVGSPFPILMADDTTHIQSVAVEVTHPFGVGSTLTIGEPGNSSNLMAANENILSRVGMYTVEARKSYPGETSVHVYVSTVGQTGSATVTIYY